MAETDSPKLAPIRAEDLWTTVPEAESLIQSNNHKQDFNTSVDSKQPSPTRLGPIQLPPDDFDGRLPYAPGSRWIKSIKVTNIIDKVPAEHRSTLHDVGRGCLMVLATPIALTGAGLYGTGVIIEGIALVLKGVGVYGVKFLTDLGKISSQSARATTEAPVAVAV